MREYWIQVDSFPHNLVPTGKDGMMGTNVDPAGAGFTALGYRAYSPHWKKVLAGNEEIGPNRGIPGPVIRAHVGDTVKVHFRNNDTEFKWPHSMHPHGVSYTPENDGGHNAAAPTPGSAVPFGESFTYTWTARASSVGTWPYHDHSMPQSVPQPPAPPIPPGVEPANSNGSTGMGGSGPVMELSAELGMLGIIAVTDKDTPKVDREFFLFFHDMYQADVPGLSQDFDCFNGRSFLGNTPTFKARNGERVRWRIASLGKEFHVFHLHGHRWRNPAGAMVDSEVLGPSTSLTVEYTEDNPGKWLYHCHVTDHMAGGMIGLYEVT